MWSRAGEVWGRSHLHLGQEGRRGILRSQRKDQRDPALRSRARQIERVLEIGAEQNGTSSWARHGVAVTALVCAIMAMSAGTESRQTVPAG